MQNKLLPTDWNFFKKCDQITLFFQKMCYNIITKQISEENIMSNNTKFFICEHCGNLVETVHSSGVPMVCCGQKMTEIVAGTVEASREKHIPVAKVEGDVVTVTVGSVEHPMAEEHSILWVELLTDKGSQRKNLEVGKAPVVEFALKDEKPLSVYAYCNLHGLWKSEF